MSIAQKAFSLLFARSVTRLENTSLSNDVLQSFCATPYRKLIIKVLSDRRVYGRQNI